MRMKLVISACLLLSAFASAQVAASRPPSTIANLTANISKAEAACGDPGEKFRVYRDQDAAVTSIPMNKARVVIVEEGNASYVNLSFQAGGHLHGTTLRVGLDGKWIGAIRNGSYISFLVEPGIHHLCVQQQSIQKVLANNVTLATLSAVAGESYIYFADSFGQVPLQILDTDKFNLMIFSTNSVPVNSVIRGHKKK